jgi:fluoride exporter
VGELLLRLLLVGVGGAVGSMARHGVSLGALALAGPRFPVGTLIVNAAGCLAAGVLLGAFGQPGSLSERGRLLLMTGVLGGFTTFSAFAAETLLLVQEHSPGRAVLNAALNLAMSLGAAWVGWLLARAALG